jgi:hypothetical protein
VTPQDQDLYRMPVGRRTIKSMNHQVITKILVSAAIALGSCVAGAAPASADPNPISTDPHPFGALSCSSRSRETAPPGSPALREEMERGIRDGLSCPQAPGGHPQAPGTYDGYLLPHGYDGKP